MKALAPVLAGVVIAQPLAAYAGRHCGESSSGGSSESGSEHHHVTVHDDSSWSSDSRTSHVSTESTGCIDASDVVGYRHCSKYGTGWGMNPRLPRLFLELGTTVRQFSADPAGRTGNVWHGAENFTYRMVAPSGESAGVGAVGTNLRLGIGLEHGLYVGLEGELGGLTSTPARIEMMTSGAFGTPLLESKTALLMGAAGFVGARVSSGRASLSIEGAGGVRDVRYRYTSTYHNCEDTASVDVVQGVLEARARGELWLNPWITVGAQAGANVAAKGDWMTGLYLGFHSRAFGGR